MYIPKEIKFRESTDSAQMMNEFVQIHESIRDNALVMAEHENQIETLNSIISSDRAGLENRIAKIEALVEQQTLGSTFISLYDAERVVYPTGLDDLQKCTYEQQYGRAVLHIIKSEKLYITTDILTGNKVLVSDLDELVFRRSNSNKGEGSKIDMIIETNVTDAISPDPRKMYLARFITYDPGLTQVDLEFELNTRNGVDKVINSVRLDPMPEGSLTLDYLTYSNTAVDSQYFRNSGYGIEYGNPVQSVRRLAYSIDPVKVNQFKCQLIQANREGSQPFNFVIGMKSIVLENNLYASRSYIGFRLVVPKNKARIIGVENNLSELGDIVKLKIYDNISNFNLINDEFIYQSGDVLSYNAPILVEEGQELFILAELTKFDNTEATPELENIVITWR